MKKLTLRYCACLLAALLLLNSAPALAKRTGSPEGTAHTNGNTLYVKAGGTSILCTSWADACDLQNALYQALPGDQVWVAAGTYTPTSNSDRLATFHLNYSVAVYGGFPAAGGEWAERDWEANPTILSGDIGTGGDSADNSYHVLTSSGTDASTVLDGFTISAGNADSEYPDNSGGGMTIEFGSPTLTNLIFINNTASFFGGGMYNFASSPTLTNVSFSSNTTSGSGGGMYNTSVSNPTMDNVTFTGNTAEHDGGGMVNDQGSSPTLTNVTFSGNSATAEDSSGGGMYNYDQSSPTLSQVTFTGNSADYGGGMCNDDNSSPNLTDVTFNSNSSTYTGGGMDNRNNSSPFLTDVTFSGNSAEDYGGGMCNEYDSNPILINVTFSGNLSEFEGGGMYNSESIPNLNGVTFSKNSADYGGGIYNDSSLPILTNVTFSENSADYGGGMENYSSIPTLTNVTFSKNSAKYGYGGGVFNTFGGNPTLINVTFSGNVAIEGGGMCNWKGSNPTVVNAIFWGNTPDQIYNDSKSTAAVTYSDIQGGYPGAGNINKNPLLGPLAYNGGFTQTHALGKGSPAIDTGNMDNCPASDQRGNLRPIDGDGDGIARCDMGAYEFGTNLFLPLLIK